MSRRPRLVVAAAPFVVVAALIAGCGSSSDTGSEPTTTTTTTTTADTVEGQLRAKLDEATQSCMDAAGQISNSTAQTAAQAACDQLNSSLAEEIASAADEGKGNVGKALDDLAADCRQSTSSLPVGGDIASSFCDAIAASSSSVSGSG